MRLFLRLFFALLLFPGSSIFAQSHYLLSGYVTESESKECLIGAVVYSGDAWAVTNEYGFYSLRLAEGSHIVSCSYMGHTARQTKVWMTQNETFNISMTVLETLEGAVVEDRSDAVVSSAYLGAINMPVSNIMDMPSILGEPDVMKSLQKMPGVQPGMAGFSGIYVRGGGAEENLVLMDGAPLYNASHLMGLFSTFIPEAVKRVTLYKGFFPAKFGGRTSSVIDVRTNEGNAKKFKGTLSVGLINHRIHLEGPVKTEKSTFSFSLRSSNSLAIAPILKLTEFPYRYHFYEITGKITHRFSNSDRLILSAYHGRDRFSYTKDTYSQFPYYDKYGHAGNGDEHMSEEYDLNWGNNMAAIRWNHHFAGKLFSDIGVSWSDYRMAEKTQSTNSRVGQTTSKEEQSCYNRSSISDLSATWNLDLNISSAHALGFGLAHTFHFFAPEKDYAQEITEDGETAMKLVPYPSKTDITSQGTESSLYIEDKISTRSINASIGLRATLYHASDQYYPSLEPRVSAEYVVTDKLSVKGAYARMSQYVHMLASGAINLPTDLWVPITRDINPIFSDNLSLGLSYTAVPGWSASLEAYYKREQNILEYKDGYHVYTTTTDWDKSVEMGDGTSKGIELCIQKTKGTCTGMLAYTLSKTDRVFPGGTINAGKPFPFTYDRRHVLDCFVHCQINERIGVNAAWSFSSGNMITASWRSTFVKDPNGSLSIEPYITGRNNYRLPPSHRLDVSADFKKKKKHGEHILTVGVYNLYAAQNPDWVVIHSDLNQDGTFSQTLQKRSLLVFLPSFSYTIVF